MGRHRRARPQQEAGKKTAVEESPLLIKLKHETDRFFEIGSGQTEGKAQKSDVAFSAGAAAGLRPGDKIWLAGKKTPPF